MTLCMEKCSPPAMQTGPLASSAHTPTRPSNPLVSRTRYACTPESSSAPPCAVPRAQRRIGAARQMDRWKRRRIEGELRGITDRSLALDDSPSDTPIHGGKRAWKTRPRTYFRQEDLRLE